MLAVWVIETTALSWLVWHVEEQENMSQELPDLVTSLLKTRLALFEMACGCVSEMWLVFLEELSEVWYSDQRLASLLRLLTTASVFTSCDGAFGMQAPVC